MQLAYIDNWSTRDTPTGYYIEGTVYSHPDHVDGTIVDELIMHMDETTVHTAAGVLYQLGDRV